ncbi:hypothetical protein PAHAL_3G411700 [Panicum hallii]|uniref:ShKT domain-containing protein n=1 Tax=Panicum hallii TaxID=206008 RepID=A0A2S3HDZ6_9POAL|nr:hypothetical protein PAHAL_3G411700 [Panicum hallii]
MASTAAALNLTLLVVAVFLVLLHPSMGRQPAPAQLCPDNTGHQPAARAHDCSDDDTEQQPALTPAPAPAVNCPLYCSLQCSPQCEANKTAGLAQCEVDYAANWSGGCRFGNCTCDNTYPISCCQACGNSLLSTYFNCRNYYDRAIEYCMINCTNDCNKNCTQG